MSQLALTGARICSPFQLFEDGVLLIGDSKIESMGPSSLIEIPPNYRKVPLDGLTIAPGFIDLHFHSNGNASVMDGNAASLAELARFQATHGVTSFLATTQTAPFQQLLGVAQSYAELSGSGYKGAKCLGLYLEGPYLAPRYSGNHLVEYLQLPSYEEVMELHRNSGKGIKVLTIAPELEGALDVAVRLRKEGIAMSIGHSDADYEMATRAIKAGFTGVTHCFRELRPFEAVEPGVIGAALALPEFMVEVVSDGIHLHPAVLNLLWKARGADGLILVSDYRGNIEQKNLQHPDPQEFSGGMLTIENCLQNFLRVTHCKITEALRMVTYNPAKYVGINKKKGSLYPGKDADIVVLTSDFDVVMTMVEGEVISGLISL